MPDSMFSARRLGLALVLAAACEGTQCPTAPPMRLEMRFRGTGSGVVTSTDGSVNCPSTAGFCRVDYLHLVTLQLTAAPDPGSTFVQWGNGCSGTAPAITVNPAGTVTCEATFDLLPTAVVTVVLSGAGTGTGTVTSNPGGITCPGLCSASFPIGSTVTLTAAPGASSVFAGWSGGLNCLSPVNPVLPFTVSAAVTCTVRFDATVPVPVTVTLTGSGSGTVTSSPSGISCPGTCTASFPVNTAVTLTAASDAASNFIGWTGCSTAATALLGITATTATTCTARFDLKPNVVIISDDFDDAGALARWDIALRQEDAGSSTSESNPLTGGAPGGYRAGRLDFAPATPPALTARVDHILVGDGTHPGTYNSGPVDSLVVSLDRWVTHAPNVGAVVGSNFVIRQGANLFYAVMDPGNGFSSLTPQRVTVILFASDFSPAPNFSAPMEFGVRRRATFNGSAANAFISWGTDNFRVEVWHH